MSNPLKDRLARALGGSSGDDPRMRRRYSLVTTRDQHPTEGTMRLVQDAAASGAKQVGSLNFRRPDGTLTKTFCWGVPGFGWDEAEWPGS